MESSLIYHPRIRRRYIAAIYPEFFIRDGELYYYPSYKVAEVKIREIGWTIDIYCFIIEAWAVKVRTVRG